ncbi:hypothetical protein [Paraburkholderia sp. RL18-085-BIA-A]|jgi:hypothetical protein
MMYENALAEDQWNNVQAGQALVAGKHIFQAFSPELEATARGAGL